MDRQDFLEARKRLGKTQKQMAELMGSSIKAIQGYEQGWRSVPPHVERQVYFLLSRHRLSEGEAKPKACWVVKKCPQERREQCPAWEFQAGRLCWFINGTICECKAQKTWKDKMKVCRKCVVLAHLVPVKEEEPQAIERSLEGKD